MKKPHIDALAERQAAAKAAPAIMAAAPMSPIPDELRPRPALAAARASPPIDPAFAALHDEILDAIASGLSFDAIALLLCRRAETIAAPAICSILAIDREQRLRPIAAPSLPASYSTALDGLPIGPMVGSCGTAAFTGRPVEVRDIASDPLWAPYAHLALPLGLAACWSSPVKDRTGRIIATFAFYYRTPRGPSDAERTLVRTCVRLLSIAFERGEMQARNRQLSHYDRLTGLPNQLSFDEGLQVRLLEPRPSFGLILVDMDELKVVNDGYGYRAGDRLVQEVGRRIEAAAAPIIAYHLMSDEFAVLVDPCGDRAALERAAEAILRAVSHSRTADELPPPAITLGGAVYGLDGVHAETLRRNADLALKHAKQARRGGFVSFNPDATVPYRGEGPISEVRHALIEGRIEAHYQPVVRLSDGAVVGFEALARLRRATGELVAAGAFQPAITDPNLGHRLTGRMLSNVAADMRRWLDAGLPLGHVGINFSPADFAKADLEQRIVDTFAAAGVPLRHVIMEVTESVFLDGSDPWILPAIEKLRARGIRIALDDFGTGFASLTHLLRLPVDILKIDKSFVDRLLTDRPSAVIVEALIDMAAKLDLRVVAEGVECAEQAARLAELGCKLAQGYCFGHAEPAGMAADRLRDGGLPL